MSGRLNRNVLDRLVRYGDGWIPWGEWAGDVVHGIEVVRDAFNEAGRDWDGFEIRGTLRTQTRDNGSIDLDATMADVPEMVAAGITDFTAYLQLPDDAGCRARSSRSSSPRSAPPSAGRRRRSARYSGAMRGRVSRQSTMSVRCSNFHPSGVRA